MKYGTKEIDWAEVGAMLAHESDGDQVQFVRSFCKELRSSCGTNHHMQSQMFSIQRRLTSDERETMALLGPDGD